MTTVRDLELPDRLPALLDAVERAGEVWITRAGKPVARLIRVAPVFDRDAAKRAADGLRATSKGLRLAGLSLRELVEEGRR